MIGDRRRLRVGVEILIGERRQRERAAALEIEAPLAARHELRAQRRNRERRLGGLRDSVRSARVVEPVRADASRHAIAGAARVESRVGSRLVEGRAEPRRTERNGERVVESGRRADADVGESHDGAVGVDAGADARVRPHRGDRPDAGVPPVVAAVGERRHVQVEGARRREGRVGEREAGGGCRDRRLVGPPLLGAARERERLRRRPAPTCRRGRFADATPDRC